MLKFDPKDPADTDDFRIDLPLASGDTVSSITSVTITPTGEMTETTGSRVVDTTGVTIRLVGGKPKIYTVTVKYATAAGRTKERSVLVPVEEL